MSKRRPWGDGPKPTFCDLVTALVLPPPERGEPFIEYSHHGADFSKFKVRVHPPDTKWRVLRQWAIRAKFTVNGKEEEDRRTFGQLQAFDKTQVKVSYKDALKKALKRLEEIEKLKGSPELAAEVAKEKERLTVADAWARHPVDTRLQRGPTTTKEVSVYGRYFTHLGERYLDELGVKYWRDFIHALAAGRLLSADGTSWTKLPSKRAEATIHGVMNLAGKLYTFAHGVEGLGDRPKGWNPALEAKKGAVGKPNKRSHYVPLNRVAEVWRAADVLCASWARDQMRLYILTGLRTSLVTEMRFDEVRLQWRRLSISPHKPGTKRRGANTPANAPDIKLPLCQTALDIIEARRPWAPDAVGGPVWYVAKPPGGKAAAPERRRAIPRHSDPRSNWHRVADKVLDGVPFARHDLRRTFAQIAAEAGANLLGTSLLMLHSPRTVAATLNLPDITVEYINTTDAQGQMRRAAESIERYVLGLLDGSVTPPVPEDEAELPPVLQAVLDAADEEDGGAGEAALADEEADEADEAV